jgi:hypothetical protein
MRNTMSTTETRDLNIWKELPFTLADGYVPAVPREWQYTANRCNFTIRLTERHPSLPDYYACAALCAHNCAFAPDWVKIGRDCNPL